MNDHSLGRLEPVDLQVIWEHEAKHFTPWLANNLELLGETLHLELELQSVEQEVGPFRADIVCREVPEGDLVLIENQLQTTDHGHLGQLLTYSAGLQASTVVWLARHFTDEHRAALDWLNELTLGDLRFFGLEIELWKIGESAVAPRFNMIAKPNDWSRSVARSARPRDDSELSETQRMNKRYWAGLQETLRRADGPVHGRSRAQPKPWMRYGIGRTDFELDAAIGGGEKKYVRVELFLSGSSAKDRLSRIECQKDDIERELGCTLQWGDQSKAAAARRISYYLPDADPTDESDWVQQHDWLAKNLNSFHRAFAHRIKTL